jgi:hypothetical protein
MGEKLKDPPLKPKTQIPIGKETSGTAMDSELQSSK